METWVLARVVQNANQLGFELKITNPDDDSPKFELVNIMNNLPASFNTDAASDLVPPPPALQSNIAVKKQRSETKVVDGEVRTFGLSPWKTLRTMPARVVRSGNTYQRILTMV